MKHIRILSRDLIPGYLNFRDDADGFVSRGLARQTLREKFQKLKAERAVIKKRRSALSDLKKRLESSYDQYYSEIVKKYHK